MVGADGKWLSIGEVIGKLRAAGYSEHEQTIRRALDRLIAAGLVESHRTDVGRYRRYLASDIDAYLAVRHVPPGPERDAAMEELRRRSGGDAGERG